MYYENNANNRSLYHINFFANNEGYQSCIVENLLRYVYHTSTGLPLYRIAKKYFKFKNMRVSYNSHYNNYDLPRVVNASGAPNRSGIPLYIMSRKYGSSGSIFSCGTNTKRMSFNYMGYRYDHGMAQVEDFNNVNFVKHQL